jgi:hypothetical protein
MGQGLVSRDANGLSDPYAVVTLDGAKKKTKVSKSWRPYREPRAWAVLTWVAAVTADDQGLALARLERGHGAAGDGRRAARVACARPRPYRPRRSVRPGTLTVVGALRGRRLEGREVNAHACVGWMAGGVLRGPAHVRRPRAGLAAGDAVPQPGRLGALRSSLHAHQLEQYPYHWHAPRPRCARCAERRSCNRRHARARHREPAYADSHRWTPRIPAGRDANRDRSVLQRM